jgi:hypothetical protein
MGAVAVPVRCSRAGGPEMTPSSWQDLRDRFLDECYKEGTAQGRWHDVWHLLSQHPWFRENLTSSAKSVLRRSGCPAEWRQDIEQQAMVLLAWRLRKMPCLGIDPVQAERHFPGWMGTIINHNCRDALRKLSRGSRQRFSAVHRPARPPCTAGRVAAAVATCRFRPWQGTVPRHGRFGHAGRARLLAECERESVRS